MPEAARVIGAARTEMDDAGFRALVAEALAEFLPKAARDDAQEAAFLERLSYVTIDALGEGGWEALAKSMRADAVQAFYFSVGPSLFGALAERLHKFKVARQDARIVVEKPFGRDLASARELNATLATHFDENQIYRIDHYLGKETVQNLMAVRFGNVLFEPLWNSQYIDHVQITVAEEVGIGGRGAYYDKSGAMRDMVQNHLMQLLCLTAMEAPTRFEPDAVRDEKLKVIRALEPVAERGTGTRPVPQRQGRGLVSEGRRGRGQQHRKLHRHAGRYLELALEGHTVLFAHRQADAVADVRDRHPVPRRAAFDL